MVTGITESYNLLESNAPIYNMSTQSCYIFYSIIKFECNLNNNPNMSNMTNIWNISSLLLAIKQPCELFKYSVLGNNLITYGSWIWWDLMQHILIMKTALKLYK
jgi:hypothetical protein